MKIVHFMRFGQTPCGLGGTPNEWPEDHKWDSDWDNVTCYGCMASYLTFRIAPDGKSITCLRCKRTSSNANDVAMHYCGNCHVFHDDIWPPARHWWVNHKRKDR